MPQLDTSPAPLTIKAGRQFPFVSRHPWVHLSSLQDSGESLAIGGPVEIFSSDGRWIAAGLVNPQSRLRVRLYSWNQDEPISTGLFQRRIDDAIARRRLGIVPPAEGAERLIFSESDNLSGLIVDRYADFLTVQVTSGALQVYQEAILDHLQQRLNPRGICVRIDEKTAANEGMPVIDQWVRGEAPSGPVLVQQNGLSLGVDLLGGQKTGTYLDQRTNHAAAAPYLFDRRVLDVCCYSGGFGLVAASTGAAEVLGIDGSVKALEAASENAQRNGLQNIRFERADCFEYLEDAATRGLTFDAIVLDPPRFAGSRHQIDSALRAYQRLNTSAVELLPKGGILVTCSCSGRVSRSDFLNMLAEVARRTGRDITILESRGAAPDHPISASCPETDYLKCMICQVN